MEQLKTQDLLIRKKIEQLERTVQMRIHDRFKR
jgi:hypothetical protein